MRFAALLLLVSLGLSDAGMWGDSVAAAMKAARKLKENVPSTEAISEAARQGAAALSGAGATAAQVVTENTPAALKDAGTAALGATHGIATQAVQAVAENTPAAVKDGGVGEAARAAWQAAAAAATVVAENAPASFDEVATVVSGAAKDLGNAVYNNTRDKIEAGTKAVGIAARKLGNAAYAAANATLEASLRAIDAALQATFGIGLKDVPGLIKRGTVHASNIFYFAFVCLSFGMSLYFGLGLAPAIFANVMVAYLGTRDSSRLAAYLIWAAYGHSALRAPLPSIASLALATHISPRARPSLASALPPRRVPLCGEYPGTFVAFITIASLVLQRLLGRLLSGGGGFGGSARCQQDLAGPNTRKLADMLGDDKLAATPLILLRELELRDIRAALQEQAAALAKQAGVMSALAGKFAAMEEARAQLTLAEFEAKQTAQKDADLKSMGLKKKQ